MEQDKHKAKLELEIKEEVTKLFEHVLDYAQVACVNSETYKVLRGKILRVGNNCIRTLKNKLSRYSVEYIALGEDIVQIKKPIKGGKGDE